MTRELNLYDSIDHIKGVGEKKKASLVRLGIFDIEDLLKYIPIRYQDKRKPTQIRNLIKDSNSLILGKLTSKKSNGSRFGNSSVINCSFEDVSGSIKATFFNRAYLFKELHIGSEYSLFGKLQYNYGKKVFVNPEIALYGSPNDIRGIIPVYGLTKGLTNKEMIKYVRYALQHTEIEKEWLDPEIVKDKYCDLEFAYNNIHFPSNERSIKVAKYRLVYEELLLYQAALKTSQLQIKEYSVNASVRDIDIKPFLNALSFTLTEGQKQAVEDISRDLIHTEPMNRLIQGDVGCGKTVVAECAIYKVVKSRGQCVFMAPTEILARQHYKKLSSFLSQFDINVRILTGSTSAKERKEILENLKTGTVDLLIGTHAVIQEDVIFNNLLLIVTDEQHRFGVNQRMKLTHKSKAANVLVMSATPIPRTLASTVFGDMDFTVIKSMPSNRKTIITVSVGSSSRNRAYKAVEKQLALGYQGYIVVPSIKESENVDLNSLDKIYEEMKNKFSGYRIALIHGKLSKDEKEKIMQKFLDREIDLLISTVVIEVGIDVPTATIIVIENSERFGLAQLHQLRGRVGRSDKQSYCFLINYSSSNTSKARMKAMVEINDGFNISEEDYKLRGPGNIIGTEQSGVYGKNILYYLKYIDILETAGRDAVRILTDSCDSTNKDMLKTRISKLYRDNYSDII